MESSCTIALLGQPNAGKSTLFNGLTGARQHVGNWPGKTVEQKEGYFKKDGVSYTVVDLPGSYSLSANSDEEIVTRDYIASGKADVVCILADASQLERSLFMLADYTGIHVRAILLLNMMDVAKAQGKEVNCTALEKELGIPVLPFVAANRKEYPSLYAVLQRTDRKNWILRDSRLKSLYEKEFGETWHQLSRLLPEQGIGVYSAGWLAAKLIEQDPVAHGMVQQAVSSEQLQEIDALCRSIKDGSLHTGDCKFQWIDSILSGNVSGKSSRPKMSRFDIIATSKIWGKPLALIFILIGLFLSLIVGAPLMMVGGMIPSLIGTPLAGLLNAIGTPHFLVSLLCDGVISAIGFAFLMSGFVFGTSLVFGFAEEVGYMARISYVFDNTMQKLGLHGKAIMPFLVSFGCNIGGATGTRVLDTWGQKAATIALSWVVPCSSTWAVVGLVSSLFFGVNAVFVILSLFLVAALHLFITAKIFGKKLLKESDRTGLIMELPPYHKPRWGNLFRYVFSRMGEVLKRAIKIITCVSIIFWALSYTPDGVIENSIIYKIGTVIEPVTMWFGLRWQTFMAWLASGFGKESCLGVLSALFNSEGIWNAIANQKSLVVDTAAVGSGLLATITKPEALAFIYAFFFNMPCMIAFSSAVNETHSWKWMIKIALYYIAVSLILATIVYHIGLLIF